MLQAYIQKALEKAQYKQLEDQSWFAEVPGLQGVWANGDSVEYCREELGEVIEEWLFLKIYDHDKIPEIDGIKLEIHPKKISVIARIVKDKEFNHDLHDLLIFESRKYEKSRPFNEYLADKESEL